MALTAFSFGYEGWGPHTPTLIRALDAVEADRGFAPPLVVDTRIRREVRAVGFRGNALGELLGERYRWMPGLGNRSIISGEDSIVIAKPEQAVTLLDLILDAARQNRRVVFFCSCGPVEGCHRQVVGSLILKEASRRGIDLEVVEWPGEAPQRLQVPVSADILTKVARGRKSVPLPSDDLRWSATPWFSTAVLSDGERVVPILTGPAKFSDGWTLPVLAVGDDPTTIGDLARRYREDTGVECRRSCGEVQVHPYCVYHIRHSETLASIAEQPNGEGTLLEKGDWSSVARLLHEADLRQERLLMVLDNAEEFVGVNWVAQIDGVRIEDHGEARSLVQISGLRQLPTEQWFPRSELRLKRTGQMLDPGYLRGKLICHTPDFLRPHPKRPVVYLNEPEGRMKSWLRQVYAGDFSAMPARITVREFFELHSAIDGYRIAEEFGYGDLSGFGDMSWRMLRQFEETGRWSGTALDLWLCLYFQCRAARHSDGPLDERMMQSLYGALRDALQGLSDADPEFLPNELCLR